MGAQQSTPLGRTKSLDGHFTETADGGGGGGVGESSRVRPNSHNRLERDKRSKSTMIVVNHHPKSEGGTLKIEDDPLFHKLNELPLFVPLMYAVENSLNMFGGNNRALEEIRRKIEPSPFIRIVRLYEERLKKRAVFIRKEQGIICRSIREADMQIYRIFKTLSERQKKFARHVERIGAISEISHTLQKCQTVLKAVERNLQILNGILPLDERLEPFSWPELLNDNIQIEFPLYSSDTTVDSDESVEIAVESMS